MTVRQRPAVPAASDQKDTRIQTSPMSPVCIRVPF